MKRVEYNYGKSNLVVSKFISNCIASNGYIGTNWLDNIKIKRIKRFGYAGERQFMIAHPFDGLDEPLYPEKLTAMMVELIGRVEYKKADCIIGLDATGIIPATAASLLTGLPLRVAYKANLDIKNKIIFKEPGTPHPDVYIYNLPKGTKVIIVDDEIRSGRTMCNCIKAIKQCGSQVMDVIVPVESTKFGARKKIKKLGYDLISYAQHDF
ncbi:MAG: phosphoribosyltransferase [Candidatus Pacearchaeota archaeon]